MHLDIDLVGVSAAVCCVSSAFAENERFPDNFVCGFNAG